MSYRGPNQFNRQFSGPTGAPAGAPGMGGVPTNIGPVSSSKSAVDQFEDFSKKIEDLIDDYTRPLKPYVVSIGRSFIVATFYEDSLRIFSQWNEQVYYLHNYKHIWKWLTVLFLITNIVLMIGASTLLILRRKNEIATGSLIAVVILQGIFMV